MNDNINNIEESLQQTDMRIIIQTEEDIVREYREYQNLIKDYDINSFKAKVVLGKISDNKENL